MKHWLRGISLTFMVTILLLIVATPSHGVTIAPVGLSQLVCVLGIDGDGTYPFHDLTVTVANDNGSSADVTISTQQGRTSATYHITYSDTDGDHLLDCGDVI